MSELFHDLESGGLLDELAVNQLRYLDGTPKGSTGWIDSGWALVSRSSDRGTRDRCERELAIVCHEESEEVG